MAQQMWVDALADSGGDGDGANDLADPLTRQNVWRYALRGLRDRALLLVGFAGALRRSELAAIRVDQLKQTERGLRLTLPQSKLPSDSARIAAL
ncbi:MULTISPECIES: hypothetical protein [unclassified Acidiphilium]|uniref:hypothetical protein n=1 Tax=unclassified Acidiphilium TaxID=2617493 RepID=UPI0004612F5B|nr:MULTISPECIES: hypothetical protein [unclassified Acidiphilium]KDM66691.1 hypothetical protein ACIDI_54c00010 [Acidiphilium sp. JA12-A1]HQT62077.1 hypothetical protein [Acidiphilium sp.]HQT73056.1 hypothetical protein [Acidiphilium sp.]